MLFRRNNNGRAGISSDATPNDTAAKGGAEADPYITLGVNVETGEPFRFPRRLLGHMHCRGMSGSGKSSLTLVSLVHQLLGVPVFVIDLGGDQNLFHNLKQSAERSGKAFRYLTLDQKLHSDNFPPFQTLRGSKLHVTEVCQRLIRSFHLDYGISYGASYYAAQALAAMLSIASKVFAANPNATLADIDRHLNQPTNKKAFKDADSIRMNVRFLLEYPQLGSATNPDENLLIERAIEENEVSYFFCPTLDDPIVAPIVGGMALATIIHIASERAKAGHPRVPIFVVIDEFAEIVGRSLGALLAQGRKYGLRFILANQSTSQLETKDTNLVHAVFENTSIKQYFTSLGDDVEVLQSLSKDAIRSLGGSTVQGLSTSVSFRDTIVPSLERDKILEVSQTFGQSFFVVNDGSGFRPPVVVQQTHQFDDLSERPMPPRKSSAETLGTAPKAVTAGRRASSTPDGGFAGRNERIVAAIAKMKALESWELE
ncbi:MAG: TraM recognition domain-containing protein [Pirellulales bacterium]